MQLLFTRVILSAKEEVKWQWCASPVPSQVTLSDLAPLLSCQPPYMSQWKSLQLD